MQSKPIHCVRFNCFNPIGDECPRLAEVLNMLCLESIYSRASRLSAYGEGNILLRWDMRPNNAAICSTHYSEVLSYLLTLRLDREIEGINEIERERGELSDDGLLYPPRGKMAPRNRGDKEI